MKKRLLFLFLATVVLFCGGCHRRSDTNLQRSVVTRIIIDCDYGGQQFRRHYTSPEKMRLVLLYIRSIRSPFIVEPAPEALNGSSIQITTISADETTKIYRQQADQYFQEGMGGWEKIDPEKAAGLWNVILATPSDPE